MASPSAESLKIVYSVADLGGEVKYTQQVDIFYVYVNGTICYSWSKGLFSIKEGVDSGP